MDKILLVEDDTELAELTSKYLKKNGYNVDTIGDGLKAIEIINQSPPDLLILDIMLPGADGLEVCKSVSPKFPGLILMLTARNQDMDQILGLEVGADDYISKPVEPKVLLARIHALLRRKEKNIKHDANRVIQVNDLIINDESRSVTMAGEAISMSNAEYDLLWLLTKHAGEILTREFILENLRGISYDGFNRSIDINISRLRTKLKDNTASPIKIKTIRNKGYLFTK